MRLVCKSISFIFEGDMEAAGQRVKRKMLWIFRRLNIRKALRTITQCFFIFLDVKIYPRKCERSARHSPDALYLEISLCKCSKGIDAERLRCTAFIITIRLNFKFYGGFVNVAFVFVAATIVYGALMLDHRVCCRRHRISKQQNAGSSLEIRALVLVLELSRRDTFY